jgi:hypothetical protein
MIPLRLFASITLFVLTFVGTANAIVIPVSRDTLRTIAVLTEAALLAGATVCFYKKLYGWGALLLAMAVGPWIVAFFFVLSGTPVRWW